MDWYKEAKKDIDEFWGSDLDLSSLIASVDRAVRQAKSDFGPTKETGEVDRIIKGFWSGELDMEEIVHGLQSAWAWVPHHLD